jgi:hypothetical protein
MTTKCYTKRNDGKITECSNDYFESLKRQVLLLECIICHDKLHKLYRIENKENKQEYDICEKCIKPLNEEDLLDLFTKQLSHIQKV